MTEKRKIKVHNPHGKTRSKTKSRGGPFFCPHTKPGFKTLVDYFCRATSLLRPACLSIKQSAFRLIGSTPHKKNDILVFDFSVRNKTKADLKLQPCRRNHGLNILAKLY